MTVVIAVCVLMLAVAGVCLVIRMTKGPTVLDRALALDVLLAVCICGIALDAAWHQRTFTLPVLLVLTMLGFTGSVSIARFTRGSEDIEADRS